MQKGQAGMNTIANGDIVKCSVLPIGCHYLALHDEFGFGNTNPEKWDKLQDRANSYLVNILKYIDEGEAEMGFEKIVEGMYRARPDIAPEIEERYKKVLYNFNK